MAAAVPTASLAACEARSGPTTAALVELYTSEGCSSCPPADRALRRIREVAGATATVVPLALHVDYWDGIGWKDPFSKPAFGTRQSRLVHLNQHAVVYTPHFFVGGMELGGSGMLGDEVRRQNVRPARADIQIKADLTPSGTLVVDVEATTHGSVEPAALYLAVTESGLESKVTRGENAGSTLAHDHVVREWIGPIRLAAGALRTRREVAIPATWSSTRLNVVGFVEDETTGGVLQAISAGNCAKS
ncbi:MAG: DUF1223 domain-containing protein [Betaproteobacteria bacterium]